MPRDPRKPSVPVEELQATLDELAKYMLDQAEGANERVRTSDRKGVYATTLRDKPDLTQRFVDEVRAAMQEEVITTHPVAEDEDIDLSERETEIAKRALLHLRLDQLRSIAEDLRLDRRGASEELADRIARALKSDEEEVARLILAYSELRPERGLADRIYGVRPSASISPQSAVEMLNALRGRYVRVGVAKWFVFREIEERDGEVIIDGLYRSYRAVADHEGDQFFLARTPVTAEVRLRWETTSDLVQTRARGATEADAAVRALAKVTTMDRRGGLALSVEASDGELMRWDHRSVFMLHVLNRDFSDGVEILNLSVARFETEFRPSVELRPSVRAVRFEGQHLLSSRVACQLLVEGRALVDISMFVRFSPSANTSYLLPVRIAIQQDHITVLTGFGTENPRAAAELQRLLLGRIYRTVREGVVVDSSLERLATQIRERAEAPQAVERADILAEPEQWVELVQAEI